MRLVTFNKDGTDAIGAFEPKTKTITDFTTAGPEIPTTMLELIELGLFEKEKKRLNKMANEKKLLGRENYKKELNVLLTSNNKKRKQK